MYVFIDLEWWDVQGDSLPLSNSLHKQLNIDKQTYKRADTGYGEISMHDAQQIF